MMEPITLSLREAIIYGALIGAGIGLVVGLIPFVLGIAKGKAKVGLAGLGLCIAAGAIWTPLALIPLAIFTWLVLKKVVPETISDDVSS